MAQVTLEPRANGRPPEFDVPASPAGPAQPGEQLHVPPAVPLPGALQMLRFSKRQIEFVFRARRELGDVFMMRAGLTGGAVVTCHPDHVRSLFTADPDQVPSLTAESPLRPVVGAGSVLTANGARHLRQRKLLLPSFHGDAIDRYTQMIGEVTKRELDRWPLSEPFALAPRMQAITLEVIMSGIFGVHGAPAAGSPERRLRSTIKYLTAASTSWWAKVGELANMGRAEPVGLMRAGVSQIDRVIYPIVEERRRASDLAERTDILSLLLGARSEEGEPLSDHELRDEAGDARARGV